MLKVWQNNPFIKSAECLVRSVLFSVFNGFILASLSICLLVSFWKWQPNIFSRNRGVIKITRFFLWEPLYKNNKHVIKHQSSIQCNIHVFCKIWSLTTTGYSLSVKCSFLEVTQYNFPCARTFFLPCSPSVLPHRIPSRKQSKKQALLTNHQTQNMFSICSASIYWIIAYIFWSI